MSRRRCAGKALSIIVVAAFVLLPLPPQHRAEAKISLDVRQAVEGGLDYLARTQRDDGSWSGTYGQAPGVVGIVLMAFFAHGDLPGRGPYKDTIDKAIKYILANSNKDGLISRTGAPPMYNHGFATLALAEAYGMSPDPEIERALRKAVDLIVRTQNKRGGWRYQPMAFDDDITVSGAQLMALRAADNAGIHVPSKTIEKGIAYIESCHVQGGFGYQPNGSPGTARTGIGVLLLELLGKEDSEPVKKGIEYLKHHPPRHRESYFYYGIYYCSQAVYQYGGATWNEWNESMTAQLLRLQIKSGAERGSWPQSGSAGGKQYATAMALLALQVNWRYLPIYQR